MKTILGVEQSGVVRLVSSGEDSSIMPTEWNGRAITAHVLDDPQEVAYAALPSNRGGTLFDGSTFVTLPAVVQPALAPQPTLQDVIAVLDATQKAALDALIAAKP